VRNEKGHGKRLSYYDFGATTVYAAQADPRFAYCAYVPESYDEDADQRYPLAVLVHGTERGMLRYRDAFAGFAEREQAILLCPLFPANICFPGDLSSYKLLKAEGLRYDVVLLGVVDEMAAKYRLAGDRVLMYGFSGGAHFTHRFLYLHPERLLGASVAAPGVVTLLDQGHDWWVGVRDIEAQFGKALDLGRIREVPVQLLIGDDDLDPWEITIRPEDAWWMPGADLAGPDRNARIRALEKSLRAAGVTVRLETAPGVAHDDRPLIPRAEAFFAERLRDLRAAA
jgi:pimeloyl-ACP methyl ester carboxylesterase